jgi:hypothetical protein
VRLCKADNFKLQYVHFGSSSNGSELCVLCEMRAEAEETLEH